ncbi:MAG TPA: hypothetical protein VKN99_26810, partial [Polyangia bacterium]|nr:hypothetical protein [Polyangia bacterium]
LSRLPTHAHALLVTDVADAGAAADLTEVLARAPGLAVLCVRDPELDVLLAQARPASQMAARALDGERAAGRVALAAAGISVEEAA